MNSQQIRGPSRGKCWYLLDSDKGQTKHLSSMSSLWRTTRISRWMTPTLTTVLIRPFLNLFFANGLLLMFWRQRRSPLNSTPSTSVTATDRLQTMNPRDLSHADCQVVAWDFFSGQTIRKLVPCEGSRQHALPAQKGVFHLSKLTDIFYILFQTRVKMYLVLS